MGGRAGWLPDQAATEGSPPSQRVRPPASIAPDRGYGIAAAIGTRGRPVRCCGSPAVRWRAGCVG